MIFQFFNFFYICLHQRASALFLTKLRFSWSYISRTCLAISHHRYWIPCDSKSDIRHHGRVMTQVIWSENCSHDSIMSLDFRKSIMIWMMTMNYIITFRHDIHKKIQSRCVTDVVWVVPKMFPERIRTILIFDYPTSTDVRFSVFFKTLRLFVDRNEFE